MYPHLAYVFIDGGYLRSLAKAAGKQLFDPLRLAKGVVESSQVQTMAYDPTHHPNALFGRVAYYDALPEGGVGTNPERDAYFDAIELQNDLHLGFGATKGLRKKARQKGVDVQLAVDLITGAYAGLFDIAILIAGDADFVPAIEEAKRRGVMTVVAASESSLSEDLRRSCDRFVDIPTDSQWLGVLHIAGKSFSA